MERIRTERIVEKMLRLRISQMLVNEKYKNNEFKVPIHLALGHEAIAAALHFCMKEHDRLVCSHRNIHYNLCFADSPRDVLDEYYLKGSGLAGGTQGSMNLANPAKGIVYTSNILGNNLSIATGLSLASSMKNHGGAVSYVVTGDGAMEEGAFYEALELMKSLRLPIVVVVENNDWSLATQIHERRCHIDIGKFAGSMDIGYVHLEGNNVFDYIDELGECRERAVQDRSPVCVEVMLSTLGDWRQKTDAFPDGKYINYHAGPAPTVSLQSVPVIERTARDPIFILAEVIGGEKLKLMADRILSELKEVLK